MLWIDRLGGPARCAGWIPAVAAGLVLCGLASPVQAQQAGAVVDDAELFEDEDLGDDDLFADDDLGAEAVPEGDSGTTLPAEDEEPAGPPTQVIEAPPPIGPTEGVEEILITGEAAVGVTQDDATSAVSFDQDELLAEGISDIRDLSNFTPNLEIKTAFASVNPTLFIRGVGLDDFNANSASTVSVYQDGVYMNSPAGQLFGLYDVENVEVLRGPQPTLTNASAGAILVESRKPTDEFEAYLTSSFGNYNLKEFQGALNVPIVPGLAARGAFKVRQRDGTTENVCPKLLKRGNKLGLPPTLPNFGQCVRTTGTDGFPPGPTELETDVNDVDNWAARGLVSATLPLPGEQEMDWLLQISGGQNNSLAAQFQHTGMQELPAVGPGQFFSRLPNGRLSRDDFGYSQDVGGVTGNVAGDPFKGQYDRVGPERLDLLGASLSGSWLPTDSLEVESISAYFWHDRETFANDDAGPRNWLNNDYTNEAWQFSQEAKLRWLWGEENEAVIGGYFLTEDLDAFNIQSNARTNGTFEQGWNQETMQGAIFGSTHIDLPELRGWGEVLGNFSIDASARFNRVEKTLDMDVRFVGGGSLTALDDKDKGTWTDWAGDFSVTYDFTEDANIYVKYSRGWKPGHFNAGTLRGGITPVDPETVDSFEGGLRSLWFDGRLQVNLTAFAYQYKDLQVFQTTVDEDNRILRRLINSDEAEIWGVEWDLEAEPIEGLTLTFNGAYLSSEYTEFSTTFRRRRFEGGEFRTIITDADYSGNRLIASPEWSWTGSAEYRIPLGAAARFGSLRPRISFTYKDDVFFDPNEGCGAEDNIPECLLGQPDYWLWNAALTYATADERIEVTGFVRNFLNEEYKVQSFDLTSGNRLLLDVYGDPRTYGVIFTLRY